MKAKIKYRQAEIQGLIPDPKNPSLIKAIVVAAAYAQPISYYAFVCPLCNQVHTASNPHCKNPARFSSVKDRHGKTHKLSPQWQFHIQIPAINQSFEKRALAGDLSGWLHKHCLEWPTTRSESARVPE